MKLPDWALADAGMKASNAARQRKAKLRKGFVHPSCGIRHWNGERVVEVQGTGIREQGTGNRDRRHIERVAGIVCALRRAVVIGTLVGLLLSYGIPHPLSL